jgi:hypothetical protein
MVWSKEKSNHRADNGTGRVFVSVFLSARSRFTAGQTFFPYPLFVLWWQNYSVNWKHFVGVEKMSKRQSRRRLMRGIVLLGLIGVGLTWSGGYLG